MENRLTYLQRWALNGWATGTSFLRLLFIRAAVPALIIVVLLVLLLKVDQSEEILFDVLGRFVVSAYWGDTYLEVAQKTYVVICAATALLAVVVYLSLLTLANRWSPRLLAVANLALLVVVTAVHFSLLQCAAERGHFSLVFEIPFYTIMASGLVAAISFQRKNKLLVGCLAILQLLVIGALSYSAYNDAYFLFWEFVKTWGLDIPPWMLPATPQTPFRSSEVSFTPLTWPIVISAITPQVTLLFSWGTLSVQLQRLRHLYVCFGLGFMTLITSSILFIFHWSFDMMLYVGGLTIVLVWLAWIACLLTWLALFLRVLQVPALFVIIAIAIAPTRLHEEGTGREMLEMHVPSNVIASNSESMSPKEVPPELRANMAKMPALAHTYIISADGGGLRAAIFTAVVLAASDDLTCGEFGTHVRAASGVSGGALGIATWLIMREEYIRLEESRGRLPWQECWEMFEGYSRTEDEPFFNPPPMFGIPVMTVLLQDHLSMALFATLTKDLLSLPDTKAKRGQQLAESWQSSAWFTLQLLQPSELEPKAFAIPLLEVTGGIKPAPLLVFSSTDADTGELVTFSNVSLKSDAADLKSMSVGIAALNSARFPFISPPGLVQINKEQHRVVDGAPVLVQIKEQHRVVDGGFFDNTGATALYSMLKESGNKVPADAKYLRINGSIPIDKDPRCTRFFENATFPPTSPISKDKPADKVAATPECSPPSEGKASDKAAVAPACSPPGGRVKFDGWSTLKAIFAVRDAHNQGALVLVSGDDSKQSREKAAQSPLQLNMMPIFNNECPVMVYPVYPGGPPSKDESKQLETCYKNAGICTLQKEAEQLPLAWNLSQGSGLFLRSYAYIAAFSFINNKDIKVTFDELSSFITKKLMDNMSEQSLSRSE